MKVAWAAKIGMLADGGGFGGMSWRLVGFDQGSDALAGQAADLDSTGRHCLGLHRGNCSIEFEHAEACSEALLGMGTAGEDSDDQPFGLGPDGCTPALESCRRPFGIAAVRTGHMVWIGSEAGATVTTLMGRDPFAFEEDLDRAAGGPDIHLLADEVWGTE